jgi:hypothetical protein
MQADVDRSGQFCKYLVDDEFIQTRSPSSIFPNKMISVNVLPKIELS